MRQARSTPTVMSDRLECAAAIGVRRALFGAPDPEFVLRSGVAVRTFEVRRLVCSTVGVPVP
jgi:hypothetical protein